MLNHDLDRRQRILGAALHAAGLMVLATLAALVYALVLCPLSLANAECEDRIATLERRLEAADALRAEHERLAAEVAALDREVAAIAKRIPEEPLEAEFLSHLTAAATEAGLKLGDYRPGAAVARDGHWQVEIQVSCHGSYRSLCRFLDRLARLDRLSRVAQLEISVGGPEGCPASMTLVLYFHFARPAETKTAAREGAAGHG